MPVTSPATIAFADLQQADLTLDCIYAAGPQPHAASDAIARLLPVGNQGGFRYSGSPNKGAVKLVVLYTSGVEEDWPDRLDPLTGTFTYFGDNRKPGHALHDTPRQGNAILRETFRAAAGGANERASIPPFLLFQKVPGAGRAAQFRGLLVPGVPGEPTDEQLVALWRSTQGQRFQNYRARFSVLDAAQIPRSWLQNVLAGSSLSATAPAAWTEWVSTGVPHVLRAPSVREHRPRNEQLPAAGSADEALLTQFWSHFADRPHVFEACAGELWRLAAPRVSALDITRPSRDGGRDAIGTYAMGPLSDPIQLEFALEAKCYKPGNAVSVHDLARLVSRIRHRLFGVLITTSYLGEQAYRELRTDGHPIVVLSGIDLVDILKATGLGAPSQLATWLQERFAP